MAETIENLLKSIKEYSNEDISDLETIKSDICEILKTHRPIKLLDLQFGFSFVLKEDNRLIIKEENDKSKVREYSKFTNGWECSNRRARSNKCFSLYLFIKYGIVFAPIQHNDKCKTRDYSVVMKIQDFLRNGNLSEARRLCQSKKKFNISNQSLSTSILNDSALSTSVNDSLLNETVGADTSARTNLNIAQLSTTTSEPDSILVENIPEPSPNVKSEIDENEFCMILNEPSAKKPKLESPNNEPIFSLNHPSAFTLKDICKKLKIEYSHDAYKFWSDIIFQKIVSSPKNIQTHEFKSKNIFACFSQFFTGKSDSDFLLYYLINTAFRDDLVSSGVLSRLEIDSICSSNIVSGELLEFIAKFLPCRIGIYENAMLKKFGTWETENDALITLILLFENGFYSVVLDLK